jgi:hypothetical protein
MHAAGGRRQNLLVAVLCAAVLSLVAGASLAQSADDEAIRKAREANSACLGCHTESGFRSGSHPEIPAKDMEGLFKDAALFEASNHGKVECVACHVTGFNTFPHTPKEVRKTNSCEECHARTFLRIEEQFLKSVHEQKLPQTFTCTSCHDPHVFVHQKRFQDIRAVVRQDNGMCLQCHANPERFAQMTKAAVRDLHAIHAWLPNREAHWDAVRCVECHTPEPQKILSHEILAAARAERNCVSCHSVDSALRVRLYRFLVEQEREQAGFINSVIVNEAYVIGATRNRYVDQLSYLLLALVAGGIALHALARVVAALVRKRKGHV